MLTPQDKALIRLLDILCEAPQTRDRESVPFRVTASFKSRCAVLKDSIEKDAYGEDAYDGTWLPPKKTGYWTIEPTSKDGIVESRWDDDSTDALRLSRKLVFRTEEGARRKAKELGWIE